LYQKKKKKKKKDLHRKPSNKSEKTDSPSELLQLTSPDDSHILPSELIGPNDSTSDVVLRPRNPKVTSTKEVVERLKNICHEDDPRKIYRNFNKIGQG